MDCQRVNTTRRESLGSWLNKMVPPDSTCRSTWLSRWMAPVRKVPDGTTTWPPPARWQAAIAAAKAAVFLVLPSPTAPKAVTGKSLGGNQGRSRERRLISWDIRVLPGVRATGDWARDFGRAWPGSQSRSLRWPG